MAAQAARQPIPLSAGAGGLPAGDQPESVSPLCGFCGRVGGPLFPVHPPGIYPGAVFPPQAPGAQEVDGSQKRLVCRRSLAHRPGGFHPAICGLGHREVYPAPGRPQRLGLLVRHPLDFSAPGSHAPRSGLGDGDNFRCFPAAHRFFKLVSRPALRPALILVHDSGLPVHGRERNFWHSAHGHGHLHLHVHALWGVPGALRGGPLLHQRGGGDYRRPRRRAGQGGGGQLMPDGHGLRIGGGQCGHHRHLHHSAHEEPRLPAGLRRRGGGLRLLGRADHASGHGRGGLHHRRVPQQTVPGCGPVLRSGRRRCTFLPSM